MTVGPISRVTASIALTDPLFVLQLALVAAMPLVNARYFDWDAGMIAGLLIAELVAMFAVTPFLLATVDAVRDAESGKRWLVQWAKRLPGGLLIAAMYLVFGGALPLILLSVTAVDWFPWASNYGATTFGVPGPVSLLLWPFLLALAVADLWFSYTFSVAMVVVLVVAGAVRQVWRGATGLVSSKDLDAETTARLATMATPLLIMAGLSLAVSGWLTENRELTGPLAGKDPLVWAMVVLVVMRAVVAYLGAQGRETARAWQAADEGTRAVGDRGMLRAVLSAAIGVALLAGLLVLFSTPKSSPAGRSDCLATWTGDFRAASRAQLSSDAPAWRTDPAAACAHLETVPTLRLNAPIDPADLRWFTGLASIELRGGAGTHLSDLAELPSLRNVHVAQTNTPVDARTIVVPPTVEALSFHRLPLHHADALWNLGVETLMLQEVELEATVRRGRTEVATLGLDAVSGDLDAFLRGGLGVTELRLGTQAAPVDAAARLLWVARIEGDGRYDDATYCALIARMYQMQGGRAERVCGHRYGLPP